LDLLRIKLAKLAQPALRSRVDETAAVGFFRGKGPLGITGRLLRGPLRKVAFLQVPYRIFTIERANGGGPVLAFDLFTGTLDPYTLDADSDLEESAASDRNHLPIRLDAQQARDSAQQRYQRIRFQEGFFKNAGTSATLGDQSLDLYVPYWVGFFGDEKRLSVRVLNAVRRSEEGSRLRHAIASWLAEPNRSL
jgi:hypothetical protein